MLWINLSKDPLGDKWNKIVDVCFVNYDIHYALEVLLRRMNLINVLINYLFTFSKTLTQVTLDEWNRTLFLKIATCETKRLAYAIFSSLFSRLYKLFFYFILSRWLVQWIYNNPSSLSAYILQK